MSFVRTTELVVLSHPVEGLRGYVAWMIIGRDLERIKRQIAKITKNLENNASFNHPKKMKVGAYFGWWFADGYTVDRSIRNESSN